MRGASVLSKRVRIGLLSADTAGIARLSARLLSRAKRLHRHRVDFRLRLQGTIRVTWIDSAGKLFDQTLKPYGSTVIPRGLVHTIKNVGKKNSTNLSAPHRPAP